ncbi:MAG: hypothetical protein WBF47_26965, partial [Xanthobacteraceae bacterium]
MAVTTSAVNKAAGNSRSSDRISVMGASFGLFSRFRRHNSDVFKFSCERRRRLAVQAGFTAAALGTPMSSAARFAIV